MRETKQRLTAKVKLAIDALVIGGLPRAEAAAKAGILEHSLYKAMRKAPTIAYKNALMEVVRTSAASATIARIEKLSTSAESEHVRFQASEWLGGLDNIAPLVRSEVRHVGVTVPGLTIVFTEREPKAIDGVVATEVCPRLMGNGMPFPKPVPHPADVEEEHDK